MWLYWWQLVNTGRSSQWKRESQAFHSNINTSLVHRVLQSVYMTIPWQYEAVSQIPPLPTCLARSSRPERSEWVTDLLCSATRALEWFGANCKTSENPFLINSTCYFPLSRSVCCLDVLECVLVRYDCNFLPWPIKKYTLSKSYRLISFHWILMKQIQK